jgi:hypothetical protein
VPCTTLEAIMEANRLERVDLLKIDCEGAEYEILFAAAPRVLQRITDIRLEYHTLGAQQDDVEKLKRFLRSQNYAITLEKASSRMGGNLWARRDD